MKNKIKIFVGGFATGMLALLCIAGGTFDGLGPEFTDSTRTNTVTWTYGPAMVIKREGTTYTGATTNISFTRLGVTNTLKVVNGIVTGIE